MREAVREREFREFAEARQAQLRRNAYLLCGDWHHAQDLTQATLMKLYAAWGRVRKDGNVDAYARTILTRTFIDQYRKGQWREEPVDEVPGVRGAPEVAADAPELRLVMQSALMELPPRYRAVLVLRFWEDWSVEQTAEALRVTPGTVKSQCARGLKRLRGLVEGMVEGDGPGGAGGGAAGAGGTTRVLRTARTGSTGSTAAGTSSTAGTTSAARAASTARTNSAASTQHTHGKTSKTSKAGGTGKTSTAAGTRRVGGARGVGGANGVRGR